jgi:DnaA family protein
MVFSADRGPAALALALPDLRSRLSWGLTLVVQGLDDNGRLELLHALAARRALKMPEEVARYLLDRSPRHTRDLIAIVERLDRASLAEQRRLTVPFVRDSLGLA